MLTCNKTHLLVKLAIQLLFLSVISFSLPAQAEFPLGQNRGIPNLEGVQIGMSPAQVQNALEANGYTANPSAPGMIFNYYKGKDAIRFQPGKHDPVALVSYLGKIDRKMILTR